MVEFLDSASLALSMGVVSGFGVVKFFFRALGQVSGLVSLYIPL